MQIDVDFHEGGEVGFCVPFVHVPVIILIMAFP